MFGTEAKSEGNLAGTGLDAEVSVNVRLVIAPGAPTELAAAPPRRSAWTFADVASAKARVAPIVFSGGRRVMLIFRTRASGEFPSKRLTENELSDFSRL